MPFSEMPGGIAVFLEHCGDGDFSGFEFALHCKGDAESIGITSCVATATCGRTHGCGRVKTSKCNTYFAQLVKVRCVKVRMAIVASISPTLVVGHTKDNIGPVRCWIGGNV